MYTMSAHSVDVDCAGARVHCCHQLETRREAHAVFGAGYHDVTGLQRLPQYLQYLSIKLREFVQKQYAMVSEGDFAGLRP